MYTPNFNQVTDRGILLDAMQAYPFAVLFGPEGVASHLPLAVKDEGPHGVLIGHFAHANPQWKSLAGRDVLVVFSGPHSYVSPSLYVEPLSVPTWNYIAVHAHGPLQMIEDQPRKSTALAEVIQAFEPGFQRQWDAMPAGYRNTMLAGIAAFRIPILSIEGKFKLSQNRNETERLSIRGSQAAGTPEQQALARWMDRLSLTPDSPAQRNVNA